jgi:hypothetical protein
MEKLFAEFLMEKEYVCGLSKLTLQSYRVTWRTFKRLVENPALSRSTFLVFIKAAIDEGLQPKSINTRSRGTMLRYRNGFIRFAG